MIRLSIPVRQALARLTLPVLIAASFGVMLLGKADALLAERARVVLSDALAPAFGVLARPLAPIRRAVDEARELVSLRSENARLREENERLRQWHAVALALDAENATLKANLHWLPDPAPSFVTGRVVADAGGVFGRVTELGARSVRVLLLTDMNSRIPVALEDGRARAMLIGTNGPRPRLAHWTEGVVPADGERVVTSAEAGAFPAGLPVGTVRLGAGGAPEVDLAARLDRLQVVRVFDYGLRGVLPPESAARPAEAAARRR